MHRRVSEGKWTWTHIRRGCPQEDEDEDYNDAEQEYYESDEEDEDYNDAEEYYESDEEEIRLQSTWPVSMTKMLNSLLRIIRLFFQLIETLIGCSRKMGVSGAKTARTASRTTREGDQ
jgi:hypothetical protein